MCYYTCKVQQLTPLALSWINLEGFHILHGIGHILFHTQSPPGAILCSPTHTYMYILSHVVMYIFTTHNMRTIYVPYHVDTVFGIC